MKEQEAVEQSIREVGRHSSSNNVTYASRPPADWTCRTVDFPTLSSLPFWLALNPRSALPSSQRRRVDRRVFHFLNLFLILLNLTLSIPHPLNHHTHPQLTTAPPHTIQRNGHPRPLLLEALQRGGARERSRRSSSSSRAGSGGVSILNGRHGERGCGEGWKWGRKEKQGRFYWQGKKGQGREDVSISTYLSGGLLAVELPHHHLLTCLPSHSHFPIASRRNANSSHRTQSLLARTPTSQKGAPHAHLLAVLVSVCGFDWGRRGCFARFEESRVY